MKLLPLAAPLALLPLVAPGTAAPHPAAAQRGDAIAFAPAAGAKVAKSFTDVTEQKLRSLRAIVDGEEQPARDDVELEARSEIRIELTDEYVQLGKGRPDVLRRHFDRLRASDTRSSSTAGAEQEHEGEAESELEDRTVSFTWDDEDGRYRLAFADGREGDATLLEHLDEDLDFRALLPSSEVEPGDAWELEPSDMRALLLLGGDLGLRGEERNDELAAFQRSLADALAGTVRAEYVGRVEDAGAELASIRVKAELTARTESEVEDEPGQSETRRYELEGTWEVDLHWDLGLGRARSLSAQAEFEFRATTASRIALEDPPVTIEQQMVLDCTSRLECAFAPAE